MNGFKWRWAAVVLFLIGSVDTAQARTRIGLDLGIGAGVPFNSWIDYSGNNYKFKVDNSVGATLQVALLLDNWELRYAMNHFSTTGGEYVVPMTGDDITVANGVAEALGLTVRLAGQEDVQNKPIYVHTFTFGYRFYIIGPRFFMYFPLAIGLAAVSSDLNMKARVGLNINAGLGVEYRFFKWLGIGVDVRYNFIITEAETKLASQKVLLSGNLNPIDDVVAMQHSLVMAARAVLRY